MFSAVVAMSKNDDIYFGVARWNPKKTIGLTMWRLKSVVTASA